MINGLRQFSIFKRLLMMLALAAIGTVCFASFAIYHQQQMLDQQKAQQVAKQLAIASSLIDAFERQTQSQSRDQHAVATLIQALRTNSGGNFIVIDANHDILAYSDAPHLIGQSVDTLTSDAAHLLAQLVRDAEQDGAASTSDKMRNPATDQYGPMLMQAVYKPSWGWTIITGQYIGDVQQSLIAVALDYLIIMLMISLPIFGFFIVLNLSITRPLNEAIIALQDIADGDGDLSRRLEITGRDEVTDLARAFNAFTGKIETTVRHLQPLGKSLDSDADNLKHAVEAANLVADQVHLESSNVAAAINQMLTTTHDMARSTQQAADAASSVKQQAEHSQGLMQQTQLKTTQLVCELKCAEHTTQALGQSSQQIGGILDVIRSIADQTNLLALNAAIEAARAGEHGRGFAVVADEVRALATRTQNSTNEIQQIIGQIHSGISSVMSSNQATQTQSDELEQQTQVASDAINQILQLVAHISDMNTQLASATEEQTLVTEEINRNVTTIAQLTEQSVNTNQTNHLAVTSLTKISQQLATSLSQFHISPSPH